MRRDTSFSGKCWMAKEIPAVAATVRGRNGAAGPPILTVIAARLAAQAYDMTQNQAACAPEPALAVRDLRKTYDNRVEALKGVSLDVVPGDFFALLGPNGAGKSTLIGIVSSLVNKSDGEVKVFGVDLAKQRDAAMRLIGLVPQELN